MKVIKLLCLKYWGISVVLFITLISIISLFSFGLPPTHDGEYHVVRFSQFYKVLESGILYPRWAPDFNNGFGIPLFNYVYPLPNYVAALFHFLGFSFIDSFKLNMIFASFIGAIFFYLWARLYWKDLGAVVSSILYTFSPYHFVDIYVRGSVGEVWSLALFPGLLWSFTQFSNNKKPVFLLASSVILCFLILSHNILALLFFIFFISYCLLLSIPQKNKKNRGLLFFFIVWFFATIFLMTPYSSWFWDNIPLFNYFQFPWRFLSLTILIASFLGGSIVSIFSKGWMKNLFTFIFILFPILLGLGYAKAPFYHKRVDTYYLTRSNFIDGTNSPGNSFNTKWLVAIPQKRKDKFEFLRGSGSIKIDNINPQSYKLMINAKENSQIIINTAYFPGWVSFIDDKKKEVDNYNGRILIRIPSGMHKVELIFFDTSVRIESYIYFFISVVLLAFFGRKSIIGIMRK